jgi:DNA-binding PadR family transcriptional regulator
MLPIVDNARKNGSAELLILAQLEPRSRHGYEIASEIERRSGGAVSFQPASVYPVLYRMEREGGSPDDGSKTPASTAAVITG